MAGAKAAKTDRSLPLHWWWHVFEPAAPARPALLALRARRHAPSKAGLAGAAGSKTCAFESRPCWRCGLEDMRPRKPALLALRARRNASSCVSPSILVKVERKTPVWHWVSPHRRPSWDKHRSRVCRVSPADALGGRAGAEPVAELLENFSVMGIGAVQMFALGNQFQVIVAGHVHLAKDGFKPLQVMGVNHEELVFVELDLHRL